MKRLLLIMLMCLPVQAANEIRAFEPGATTCFSVVREIDGDVWYVVGQVFEAWGTGARTAADYNITLFDKTGGMFVGDMDANIGAGQYYIVSHMQIAGAPADTDPAVFQEYGDWSGTVWTPSTITAGDVWDVFVADHTAELSFGGEVGGLDPNLTLVLADTDELQQDWTDGGRLDLLLDAIKAVTDEMIAVTTVVTGANDANNFSLTAGDAADDAYVGMVITIKDADDSQYGSRAIETYAADREVRVDAPFAFTPANGDEVTVWNVSYPGLIGKIWDIIRRIPRVVNVYDFSGSGGTQGRGTIIIDAMGDDP